LGDQFEGVYAIDTIPEAILNKPTFYAITNLDKSTEQGSHWIGLAREDGGDIIVYDSFGRSIDSLPVALRGQGYKTSNPNVEQSYMTAICGPITLAFLATAKQFGLDRTRHII